MNHTSGIYAISSFLNKKIYIGYSKNIEKRWTVHRCKLNKGIHVNKHLQSAWNMYDKKSFSFVIIEQLSPLLTKKQYEEVETKWVLFYNSHLSEFGYNSTLPGSIPLYREEENKSSRILRKYICIKGEEVVKVTGSKAVFELTNISPKIQQDLCSYWINGGRRKSRWGWIIIKEEDYDETFDYISYKKERLFTKPKSTKTWRDYYNKEEHRKTPEDIIPYDKRNLKRCPVIAVNIDTGEEIFYSMFKECNRDFVLGKVRKCINNEYGKYKHRGHYFKKLIL